MAREEIGELVVDGEASAFGGEAAGSSDPHPPEPLPVYLRISQKAEIAKSANGPRLQGLIAENALAPKSPAQKTFVP